MSNSEKVKSESNFLKHDTNEKNDYMLLKSGRNVLNLPKY
jgi:hypothetical protein